MAVHYTRWLHHAELSRWLQTGQYKREQQPLMKKLKMVLLFNPLTEWLDTTHAMRLYIHNESLKEGMYGDHVRRRTNGFSRLTAGQGQSEGTEASKKKIAGFVDYYHINMKDYEPSDLDAYSTFEDFFVRVHRPGSRPIFAPEDPRRAICVADSRVVVYETVELTRKIWIKGSDFSMTNLVMDTKLGALFEGGSVASFRLSPQDYHRYHSPVSGVIKLFRSMPGDYYQVDPIALRSRVDILTRNARDYVVIETEEFGDVLFVAIGATNVGSVRCALIPAFLPRNSIRAGSTSNRQPGSTTDINSPGVQSRKAMSWAISNSEALRSLLRSRRGEFGSMTICSTSASTLL